MRRRNDSPIIMVPTPRSLPSLVREYDGRRAGIIKALTTDFEKFYKECDPQKGPLHLYGLPNETWEVKPPGRVPPEFPEPVLGINLLRDQRPVKNWLSYVAVCSEAWLLSIVFYSALLCGHEKHTRESLFNKINELPTVLEVVTEAIQAKELAAAAAANNRRSSQRIKNRQSKSQPESSNTSAKKEDDNERGASLEPVERIMENLKKWAVQFQKQVPGDDAGANANVAQEEEDDAGPC